MMGGVEEEEEEEKRLLQMGVFQSGCKRQRCRELKPLGTPATVQCLAMIRV